MPRTSRALIADAVLRLVLGAIFLAIAGLLDRTGLALSILRLPVPLACAVLAGALLPFAVCFAATVLIHRSDL